MSRINTQDERLLRGERDLEQQRSFLVQPRRFQASGSGLRGLTGAFQSISTTMRSAQSRAEEERKKKTDTATYNKLVEARNRANSDPTTYGDEYIEMYQSSLEGLDESDPLRTRILGLDADNFVSSRIEAEEQTLRGQITTGMRKTFIEIGNTYESLTQEEQLEYVNLPENERYTRLYNEYLDSFLENDPEVHDAILNHTQLETLLSQEVDRRSQTFQSAHDSILEAQAQVRFQDTVDGIVTEYETVGSWDEEQMQALATRNGIPVETVQNAVIERTLMSLQMDLEQGRLTLGDTSSKFQFLQSQAAKYGRDAEKIVYDAQGKFLSIVIQDVLNDSESKMYQGFRTGLPLEEIVHNSDTYLLSVLGDVTGEDYGEGSSILTSEAAIGLPNALLAQLRDMHESVQREVGEVQRTRSARDNLNVKSSYEQHLEAGAIQGIRKGDFSDLRKRYGGDNDIQTAFNAGRIDHVSTSSLFPNTTGHAPMILEAFVEGSPTERAWALGAISAYNEGTFRHTVSQLDQSDQIGLLSVHEVLAGTDLTSVNLSGDEFTQALRTAFAGGQALASDIGPVGSAQVTGKGNDIVLKNLGVPKGSSVSESATLELSLAQSRISALDLSDEETAKRVEAYMKTSGNTIFFNASTGLYDVFDDSGTVKILPYSEGHSREDILHELDFRSTLLGLDVIQAPDYDETERPFNETLRVFSGNWTPILGSVVAEDLGIETSGPENALLEVATRIAASKHSNRSLESVLQDDNLLGAYENLFRNEEDSEDFLRLDIGTEGGRAYLMATGFIQGQPITGQDAIIISPWNPKWNQAIGKSHEALERAEKLQDTSINTILYFANPNTLGGKSLNWFREVLSASEEAYEANPDAFKIRP